MSNFTKLLRASGLTSQKIADILGIKRARVVRWLWDRDVPTSTRVQNVIIWRLNFSHLE